NVIEDGHSARRKVARATMERERIEQERATMRVRGQTARTASEAIQDQFGFLAEASSLLTASLNYEITLSRLARLVVPYLADWCVIDMVQEDGSIRRVTAAHADPTKQPLVEELQRFPPESDGPHPITQALISGQSQIAVEVSEGSLMA